MELKKIVLFGCIATIISGSTDPLTYSSAIQEAMKHNRSLLIQKNVTDISSAQNTLGHAGLLPSLDFEASYTESRTDSDASFISGSSQVVDNARGTNQGFSITMTQTLFNGFSLVLKKQRLSEEEIVSYLELKSTIEDIIITVATYYYGVVRAESLYDIASKQVDISKLRWTQEMNRYETGSSSKLSVLDAEVNYKEDLSALIQAESDVAIAKQNLNYILGRDISNPIDIVSQVSYETVSFDALNDILFDENTAWLTLIHERNVSLLELKEATAKILYPKVTFTGTYANRRLDSESGQVSRSLSDSMSYNVSMTYNLFNGFADYRDIKTTPAQIDSLNLNVDEFKSFITKEFYRIKTDYVSLSSQFEVAMSNEDLARQRFDIWREKQRMGTVSDVDYRQAQLSYTMASESVVELAIQKKLVELELLQICGQLVVRDDH